MLPSSRVGDMHVCPLVTPGVPPIPHVGGPVLPPCFITVLTMGPPDARIMDMCTCVGPPDPISMGSSTVLVGGMPTSRMSDATSHGGALVVGAPTVLVGGPPVTLIVPPGQTVAFVQALQAALSQILPTRSGVEWLRQMGVNGRSVTFVQTGTANGFCSPDNATNAGNGTGTNSTIQWNPTHNTTDSGLAGTQGSPGAPVILAHEMVHALHNANGNEANGPNDTFPGQSGSSARNEERSTVGTGGSPINTPTGPQANPPDYSGNVPTENSFRDDLGIPRRPTYYPSNWPGGPPW